MDNLDNDEIKDTTTDTEAGNSTQPKSEQDAGQYQQPNEQYQQPNEQYQQPNGQYQQPNEQYQQPNGQYQQPNGQYQQPNGQYQQPNGQYQQPNGQYQQPNGQYQQGDPQYAQYPQPVLPPYPPKSKLAAGLLGIFLGSIGVHNFYLGYKGKAIAQLLIAVLTCGIGVSVTSIWGLIEGILILTGSTKVDGNGYLLVD